MEIASSKRISVKPKEFIVSRIDARNGAFGLIPDSLDGAVVTNDFPVFKLNTERIIPKYIEWFSKTQDFIQLCNTASEGTTNRVRIKEDKFLASSIPLPPLSEQQRIVAKIEELAKKIKEAYEFRQQTIEKAEAVLLSASNEAFKKQKGWTEARVSDFCEHPQYGYTASATMESIGPRLLRITDIQNGQVNWDTVPFCQCPNPKPYLLQKNDLLFARTGATTGKSFLIKECPEAVFASYLIRLRVKQLVAAEYLYKYFQTPSYWSQIIDQKKGTGQPNVNGKKLANIVVPIAPPAEQNRIVTYLDNFQSKVDELKRFQNETQKELDTLMPSILDKAFKGEL